jgi:hypothetical protein
MEGAFPPAFMPMPPPGTFFGVPSLVRNGENYWLIKEREEKSGKVRIICLKLRIAGK